MRRDAALSAKEAAEAASDDGQAAARAAKASETAAAKSAAYAEQCAANNGYMQMGVDENGHLMYTSTTNLKDKLDFAIVNDTNLEVTIHG